MPDGSMSIPDELPPSQDWMPSPWPAGMVEAVSDAGEPEVTTVVIPDESTQSTVEPLATPVEVNTPTDESIPEPPVSEATAGPGPPRDVDSETSAAVPAVTEDAALPRYSLRKRKAISLFPYTMLSWVQPETVPQQPGQILDLSVLEDRRPAKRSVLTRRLDRSADLDEPATREESSSQPVTTGRTTRRYQSRRRDQQRRRWRNRQRQTGQRRPTTTLRPLDNTLGPTDVAQDPLSTPIDLTSAQIDSSQPMPLVTRRRDRQRAVTSRARLHPYRHARQLALQRRRTLGARLLRRVVDNTVLFSDSDGDYLDDPEDAPVDWVITVPSLSPTRRYDLSTSPRPTARPSPRTPRTITKRQLAGKLPASFLSVFGAGTNTHDLAGPARTIPRARPNAAIETEALPHVGRKRIRARTSPESSDRLRQIASDEESPLSSPPLFPVRTQHHFNPRDRSPVPIQLSSDSEVGQLPDLVDSEDDSDGLSDGKPDWPFGLPSTRRPRVTQTSLTGGRSYRDPARSLPRQAPQSTRRSRPALINNRADRPLRNHRPGATRQLQRRLPSANSWSTVASNADVEPIERYADFESARSQRHRFDFLDGPLSSPVVSPGSSPPQRRRRSTGIVHRRKPATREKKSRAGGLAAAVRATTSTANLAPAPATRKPRQRATATPSTSVVTGSTNRPIRSFLDYCERGYVPGFRPHRPTVAGQPDPPRPPADSDSFPSFSQPLTLPTPAPGRVANVKSVAPDYLRVAHRTLRRRAERGQSVVDQPWRKTIQAVPSTPLDAIARPPQAVKSKRSQRRLFDTSGPATVRFPPFTTWFNHDRVTRLSPGTSLSAKSYAGQGHLATFLRKRADLPDTTMPALTVHSRSVYGRSRDIVESFSAWRDSFDVDMAGFEQRQRQVNHEMTALISGDPDPATPLDLSRAALVADIDDSVGFMIHTVDTITHGFSLFTIDQLDWATQRILEGLDRLATTCWTTLANTYCAWGDQPLASDPDFETSVPNTPPDRGTDREHWFRLTRRPAVQLACLTLWYLTDWAVSLARILEYRRPGSADPLAVGCRARSNALLVGLLAWLVWLRLSPLPLGTEEGVAYYCRNSIVQPWTAELWVYLLACCAARPLDLPTGLAWSEITHGEWSGLVAKVETLSPSDTTPYGTDALVGNLLLAQLEGGLNVLARAVSSGGLPTTTLPPYLRFNHAVAQVERAWAFYFALLPWSHMDPHGLARTPRPTDFNPRPLTGPFTPTMLRLLLHLVASPSSPYRGPNSDAAIHGFTRLFPAGWTYTSTRTLDEYTIHTVRRCHALAARWDTGLPPAAVVPLYRLFAHRQLDDLACETRHRIPPFLTAPSPESPPDHAVQPYLVLDRDSTDSEPGDLSYDPANELPDNAFHVFLKLCGLVLLHWVAQYQRLSLTDPPAAARKRKEILQVVSQLSPTRVMTFPANTSTTTGAQGTTPTYTYAALGNHYALLLLFLRTLPATIRPHWPLAQFTSYLDFKRSDAVARKIFFEALFFAAWIHLRLTKPVGPLIRTFFGHWRIMAEEYVEVTKANPPGQGQGGARGTEGFWGLRLTQAQKRAKAERLRMLRSGMFYINRLVTCLEEVATPWTVYHLTFLTQLYDDARKYHLSNVRSKSSHEIFESQPALARTLSKDTLGLLKRLARLVTQSLESLAPMDSPVEVNDAAASGLVAPTIVPAATAPATDGDWEMDDLDDDTMAELLAAAEAPNLPGAAPAVAADTLRPVVEIEATALALLQAADQSAAAPLRRWIIGICSGLYDHATRSPDNDDNTNGPIAGAGRGHPSNSSAPDRLHLHILRTRVNSTTQAALWCLADHARFLVHRRYKGWEQYLFPFGTDSLQVISPPAVRRHVLLIFLAAVLPRHPELLQRHPNPVYQLWFETVADSQLSCQHNLTRAIMNAPSPDRFLFHHLPVTFDHRTQRYQLTRDEFKRLRTGIIDGVLANLGAHYRSTLDMHDTLRGDGMSGIGTYDVDRRISLRNKYAGYLRTLLATMKECFTAEQTAHEERQYTMRLLHPVLASLAAHGGELLLAPPPVGAGVPADWRFFSSGVLPIPPTDG
ncbi:hypothetical protein IWQ60_010147 [Tieghemiomyces parasiticus]|uniref:Uncharacterized protein n=1 Tax=Tieghemiomyces parasiticus TaxID=78921 RepID=A0A9W7ZR46_9FUNG|nr:hypothetical protein IWQ60_010147 [Tieghemiomyces parasiticus]